MGKCVKLDEDLKIMREDVFNSTCALDTFNDIKNGLYSLDDDALLLRFDDAVYDFCERRFRPGMLADAITLTVGHSPRDVQKSDPAIRLEIGKVLCSMHEPDVIDYITRYLATSVVGERCNDTFTIWSEQGTTTSDSRRTSQPRPSVDTATSPSALFRKPLRLRLVLERRDGKDEGKEAHSHLRGGALGRKATHRPSQEV